MSRQCECTDIGCMHDFDGDGDCLNSATERFFRVDMEDVEVWFCALCAEDAFESGLFRGEGSETE
jgi:hypothetical protein